MKQLKKKKGFVSIEAVFGGSLILMCLFLLIGFFILVYPSIMLKIDVHQLANEAKIQGGLTDITSQPSHSNIDDFKDKLASEGFDRNSIQITAETTDGVSIIGATPLNEEGSNYIKRDSEKVMTVTVKVPASNFLTNVLTYFGVTESPVSDYRASESVMSERW